MLTNISQGQSTKKRIHYGMEQNICVRVTL
jgi:hypothetical protein